MGKNNKKIATSYFPHEAEKYGIIEAIVLYNIRFFSEYHKNKSEGAYYHTKKEMAEILGIGEKRIWRACNSLREQGAIKWSVGYRPGTSITTTFWQVLVDENDGDFSGMDKTSNPGNAETGMDKTEDPGMDKTSNPRNGQNVQSFIYKSTIQSTIQSTMSQDKPAPTFSDEINQLSDDLKNAIISRNNFQKVARNYRETWGGDIEKLIRIDGVPAQTVAGAIKWLATNSNFWYKNVKSGKKLRQHFGDIVEEAKEIIEKTTVKEF